MLNTATPYCTDYNGFAENSSTTPLLMHLCINLLFFGVNTRLNFKENAGW